MLSLPQLKTTPINPERATAMHEAGHAVVAVYFGLGIDSVSIEADGDSAGRVAHPPPLFYAHAGRRAVKQTARQMVVGLYAGIIAERLYDPEAPDIHAEKDETEAWSLPRDYAIRIPGCAYVGDEVYDRYLGQRRNEARKLVIRLRRVIEALADELLRHRTMRGEAVELLVSREMGRA
jgi:ATP-dependent Zn protease